MYGLLIKLFKAISSLLRWVQIAGIFYVLLFIIYWGMQVAQVPSVRNYEDFFSPLNPLTEIIVDNFSVLAEKDFQFFHADTLVSIALAVVILILFNFVFVFFDRMQSVCLARGFKTGEFSDTELNG